MAARTGAEYQLQRPEAGDILVVIHDFIARSSDELSLSKGDRVELIERDDEFGDGWFLGRHLANGNSGLFPEVYTRPTPKGIAPATATAPAPNAPLSSSNGTATNLSKVPSHTTLSSDGRPLTSHTTISSEAESTPVTLPLSATKQEHKSHPSANPAPLASKYSIGNISAAGLARPSTANQDHPVLHETLTVIDEHITDLKSTPSNGALNNGTDSSSEYSAPLHDRLSYIQGEETDEEEDVTHTRPEVESWNADDVAEFLFTTGVEKKHCEVFRDQEISGEVLLGMDQSSLFLKAFDLGSVGRRLKTWQKIKSLQDEVNGVRQLVRRTMDSDAGSESSKRMRSRTNTLTKPQKLPSIDDRPGSVQGRRLSQTPKMDPINPITPVSPKGLNDSPTRPNHLKRPSAASIRELHHSRRHSSTDFRLTGTTMVNNTPRIAASGSFSRAESTAHRKQPSFDRNWTMGNASASSSQGQRPLSSAGLPNLLNTLNTSEENVVSESPIDIDRGYFSGTEVDGRKRNVLKKRDTLSTHSQKSSYADEPRARSATAMARQSRFGSVGSIVDSVRGPSTAAQTYYGITGNDLHAASGTAHRRSASTKTTESIRPVPPAKDNPPPVVTKLDKASPVSSTNRQVMHSEYLAKSAKLGGLNGLRAISDAVTGNERVKLASPSLASLKDSPMQSPSRTGSSTPSAGPSFELDSPDTTKSPLSATTSFSQNRNKPAKNKKDTSAYQRGLLKIPPREAIKDADYSGWMKKKSSHLMTTWKPRLFVLKGRRLAYYYSEDDTEEKGLIDISFHRVLPADNDRLTGLHATITGASNTPIMPADSNLPTGSGADSELPKGDDSMFIFKLVPPRAGLSRAVNFTKPTVHFFAVPNLSQGRMWMAALMKATIDRDDTKPMTSTYQQKTISLAKARQMRHRPPALMNLDEKMEEGQGMAKPVEDEKNKNGLGITFGEVDSAISGVEKIGMHKVESTSARNPSFDPNNGISYLGSPQSA